MNRVKCYHEDNEHRKTMPKKGAEEPVRVTGHHGRDPLGNMAAHQQEVVWSVEAEVGSTALVSRVQGCKSLLKKSSKPNQS